MFNFASKVINTIGDLISDTDPKQSQPSQPTQTQRRFSGDGRFLQQKPRFQTPSDDHLPRTATGQVRPSSQPVYRYPTPTYRPSERYEESKFKAPDIDYNEDGYNVGRNYNGGERQSYITDIQKEYGMYREHDVDDVNDYEEEDRYSLNFENGNRRRRSVASERGENLQTKNTEEYSENVIYSDPERNYYGATNESQSYDGQFGNTYTTDMQTNNDAQFAGTSAWMNDEDEYHKSRRRRKSADEKFHGEDKISSSPPSQDEDARNSSRSESESSDEISFGEALATGLIPPNITPEIAARMNIELINHPKAVIESFYGHSPGEVYTIPEEEDEICSPTGADGVTSLRKQRMASARVESSSNEKELQRRTSNQQSEIRLKQKYGGQSLDSKIEVDRQIISDEMKENRPIACEFTSQDTHKQFNPMVKFQSEDNRQGMKQTFRYTQSSQSDNAQYNYSPEKSAQPLTPQKAYKVENRTQNYQPGSQPQPDSRTQSYQDRLPYQPDTRPEMYQADGRPQVYQFDRTYPANRAQATFQPDNRSQGYLVQTDRPGYQVQQTDVTDRPANYVAENVQPAYQQDRQAFQCTNYQPDRLQDYQANSRPLGYQPDVRNQGHQPDARIQGQQSDMRPQSQHPDMRPQGQHPNMRPQGQHPDMRLQGQPPDVRPQGHQPDMRPLGYQQDVRPQSHQADVRSQGYQSQTYQADGRPVYQPDNRSPVIQTDNRPVNYQSNVRPQGQMDTRPQITQPDVGPQYDTRTYQSDNRQGYQDTRSSQYQPERGQVYPPDNRPIYQDNRPPQGYPADIRPQVYQGPQVYQPERPQGYQPERAQGYAPDNRSQTYSTDNRSNFDNRDQTYSNTRSQFPPDIKPQVYQDGTQPAPTVQPDNREKEPRRLPQPQYDDQSQRQLPQNIPPEQRNVYPEDARYGYRHHEDDKRPSQDYRRPADEDDRQYDQNQSRRRLPLRKHNSEERRSSIQQDYERRNSHESPGRMQHDEYDSQTRQRTRYAERLKHRSSSLEHDRNDSYYSRSRSSSFERTHDPYDDTDEREHRRALEHKKILPRVAQERQVSPKAPSKVRPDKTRKQEWQEIDTQGSRNELKTENFCLQHKKFTTVAKPGRRVLPKEPPGQAQRRNVKRTQTQDKSGITTKSEGSQRTGILSNAARKTERSGHLKITFSDPISNLLTKKTSAGVASQARTDASKTLTTRSDKTVITSDTLPQSKNYIYPVPSVKVANPDLSHSPVPSAVSPLYRNQAQLDTSFRDSRLSIATNSRSLPIPIANRTCSLDRYSSSETNLNASPYYDQFVRPGSAPGLMYEPVHQPSNQAFPMSLYEMHALKKEEKFWSDIYSALPADMKHLIANRNVAATRKLSGSNASFSSVVSSPATVIGGGHPAERTSLENRMMQRTMISKGGQKVAVNREQFNSSLGERIGNRLRMLHEMKEQAGGLGAGRRLPHNLSRRSASDGEYSFSSSTNFPLCWNLARRPHSDSAIDLIDRLDVQNSPARMSGSAYNSSEYLTKVVDKSQSYLTSPCTNVPPSPAPTQPVRMLRDTALRGDHTESVNYPVSDNRSGFFSCLQNIESLTRQYEEEDRMRNELENYDDEIYSEPGISDTDYGRYYDRRNNYGHRRRDQF